MDAVAALMAQDRDQCFSDWGVEITLREVLQTYEPEAGELAESFVDHELIALVQAVEMTTAPGTAGQHTAEECVFLVRREDVAEEIPLRTARIVHAEVEYRVAVVDQAASGGLIALRCRRA
jgi:hypothetical protein